jgi:simple sugar transport system permease protein
MTGVGESAGRALLVPALALVLALVVGAFIIMVTDVDAWRMMGEDTGAAIGDMLSGVLVAYRELFQGAFGSVRAISETLFTATPLILAGLAVAVGFRTGLFNIGARGQMYIGGLFALWVGLHVELPAVLHIPLAVAAAIVGGGLWGGLAGFLKARTGAHEVITTIMLNFVAAFFVLYVLKTSVFQAEGRSAKSGPILSRRACLLSSATSTGSASGSFWPLARCSSSSGCCSGRPSASSSGQPVSRRAPARMQG